jgi:hypothetical protein
MMMETNKGEKANLSTGCVRKSERVSSGIVDQDKRSRPYHHCRANRLEKRMKAEELASRPSQVR